MTLRKTIAVPRMRFVALVPLVVACGTSQDVDRMHAGDPHHPAEVTDAGPRGTGGASSEGGGGEGKGTGGKSAEAGGAPSVPDAGHPAASPWCAPGQYQGPLEAFLLADPTQLPLHCDLSFVLAPDASGARLVVGSDRSTCLVPGPTRDVPAAADLVGALDCGLTPPAFAGRMGKDISLAGVEGSPGHIEGPFDYTLSYASPSGPILTKLKGTWSVALVP